jgi:DNA-binding response OmpR family regulator
MNLGAATPVPCKGLASFDAAKPSISSLRRSKFMPENAALVVNDRECNLVVRTALECAGFECREFTSIMALLRGIKRDDLRLVVLDVDEREHDWRSVLEWRSNWLNPEVAIIAIGQADTRSAASALDAGMDDYVAKPVHGAELLARIGAVARRRHTASSKSAVATLAGGTLDRETSSLRSARSQVPLTARELAVMQVLFEHAGQLVTRQRLATEVWGARCDLSSRTIEQHIYQLRRKLKRCMGAAMSVRSIYGCGYRLEVADTQAPAAQNKDAKDASAPGPALAPLPEGPGTSDFASWLKTITSADLSQTRTTRT